MFRTVPLSIISFSLYTQQWYMSYRFADSLQAVSKPVCIAVCTVKNCWWWTEELSETCRVLFQNKLEKLVHLVGFIIRIGTEFILRRKSPVMKLCFSWTFLDFLNKGVCQKSLLFLRLKMVLLLYKSFAKISDLVTNVPQTVAYRGGGLWGSNPPPRNSEGQTQPSCENC